ncbi:exo-1-3-beta-D-glucanase [Penicillium odoratum]|uniref:exo-1-3-beta-D-glucanase n=1 Tax=Penicillium odoratum TaxID=1167516 RepID=UPI00254943A6|nr:exo-1-3-beta-D-glucanase [Penicillium odoratum]KAJ5776806.1 exo-1-3-beta-D-glucanase [Penicillium odoratum]
MVLLDLVAGGGLIDDEDFAKAATARRALTENDPNKAEYDKFEDMTKIICEINGEWEGRECLRGYTSLTD